MSGLIFLSILLSGISISGFTQEVVKKEKKLKNPEHRWATGLAPGIVPVPGNPLSLQPGLEFYFTPKFSLLNEISFQTGKNNHSDSSALNKKFFKFKAELRFYFSEAIRSTPFFGLQFIAAGRKFDIGKPGKFYDRNPGDSINTFDKAGVNSPYQALTFQIGITRRMAENFYFESSTGYGLRFVNTEYTSVENLQKDREYGWFNIKPVSSYRYNGKLTRSQINFGLRIFYCF